MEIKKRNKAALPYERQMRRGDDLERRQRSLILTRYRTSYRI
jgi:hypothetical protein